MSLSEFEIFLWKHGVHIFGVFMLLTVGYIHYKISKQLREHDEFLKHLTGDCCDQQTKV